MIVFAKEYNDCGDLKSEIVRLPSSTKYGGQASAILPSQRHTIKFLLLLVFFMSLTFGAGQDSVAYVYRQDNLSTNNNLQLNYKFDLGRSSILIADMLRYKVFAHESSLSSGEQYSVEHLFQGDWAWGKSKSIRLESKQYQDHRTGLASTINNWALLGGVRSDDNLSFYFGGRSVERFGRVDQGWTSELALKKAWNSISKRSEIQVSGSRDQLKKNLNHLVSVQANYFMRFANVSTIKTSLHREARLQSFYTDSLGSTQSRYHENLNWQNQFIYRLSKNLKLFHNLNWGDQLTEIKQERIDQSATITFAGEDRKRLSLTNETGLELKNQNFSSISAFKVENAQNRYYIDYAHVLYQLREDLTWQIPGIVDSLSWNTMLSRLEYDTPDTNNDDDRDEWRVKTSLSFTWRPSPFYYLDMGTKLSMFHLIYLFNTRSSENYWNRNLVLWSGIGWRRQAWEGEGRARIRSNYFDYDYDDLFIEQDQPIRSFVHRSLDFQKQLTYHFSHRWSINTKLAVRWEDEGQLDWAKFVQQVTSEREQLEMIVKLFFDYKGWRGWLGYLSHERITKYSIVNRDDDLWLGKGPLLGVNHHLGSRLFLDLDARFIAVEDQDREYVLPKVYLTLSYR